MSTLNPRARPTVPRAKRRPRPTHNPRSSWRRKPKTTTTGEIGKLPSICSLQRRAGHTLRCSCSTSLGAGAMWENSSQPASTTAVSPLSSSRPTRLPPSAPRRRTRRRTFEPSIAVAVVGVVALVVGAGGLGAGIATRVMALGIIDDVRARCVNGTCLGADEAEVDRAVDLETFSTIGFIAGGLVAATGITLLVVSATSAPSVSVQASPTAVTFNARF